MVENEQNPISSNIDMLSDGKSLQVYSDSTIIAAVETQASTNRGVHADEEHDGTQHGEMQLEAAMNADFTDTIDPRSTEFVGAAVDTVADEATPMELDTEEQHLHDVEVEVEVAEKEKENQASNKTTFGTTEVDAAKELVQGLDNQDIHNSDQDDTIHMSSIDPILLQNTQQQPHEPQQPQQVHESSIAPPSPPGIITPPPSPDSPLSQTATDKSSIFSLRMAAGWKPKFPRSELPRLVKEDCGEDAYYYQEQPDCFSLGLGDGVGGWGSLGVDPSLFAWDLMARCSYVSHMYPNPDPQVVLSEGYQQVLDRGQVKAGSSTACIVVMDKESGHLRATNIGDSGLMIFRYSSPLTTGSNSRDANHEDYPLQMDHGFQFESTDSTTDEESYYHGYQYYGGYKPVFSTTERQHYFNAPYQLSVLPPEMAADSTNITDSPSDAIQNATYLQNGDVIVMASDGLWDNMYWEEVVQILERELGDLDLSWLAEEDHRSPSSPTSSFKEKQERVVGVNTSPKRRRLSVDDDDDVKEGLERLNDIKHVAIESSSDSNSEELDIKIETTEIHAGVESTLTSTLTATLEVKEKELAFDEMDETKCFPTPPATTDNSPSATPTPYSEASEESDGRATFGDSTRSNVTNETEESHDENEVHEIMSASPATTCSSNEFIQPKHESPERHRKRFKFDRETFLKNVDAKVKKVAECLTEEAAALARNPKRMSPFAKSARMNGRAYFGGKVDDITVIVAVVAVLPKSATQKIVPMSSTPMFDYDYPGSSTQHEEHPIPTPSHFDEEDEEEKEEFHEITLCQETVDFTQHIENGVLIQEQGMVVDLVQLVEMRH